MAEPLESSQAFSKTDRTRPKLAKFQPAHLSDVILPRFGLVFFNHLLSEYDTFTDRTEVNPEAYNRIGHLKDVYTGDTRPLTWGDLATLECLTLQLRNEAELRERFWAIQTRYREVAPKQFFRASEEILNRKAIQSLPVEELRARIEVIAGEFFRLCMLAMCGEAMRAKASHRVWYAMTAFLVFYVAAILSVHHWPGFGIHTLPAVLFCGAMGGFISAQRRIQSVINHGESLVGLIELSTLTSPFGSLWAPISGAVFAVVLFMLFAGGLISGDLFPELQPCDDVPGVFYRFFSTGCALANSQSAGKLAAWCFIAGFAERFVPDALARFISKADSARGDKEATRS